MFSNKTSLSACKSNSKCCQEINQLLQPGTNFGSVYWELKLKTERDTR